MKGDDAKALAAGCDDYVTKPIDVDALPALVASWLERQRARGGS
jgi:two-component system, cell cycle response regulator DivK